MQKLLCALALCLCFTMSAQAQKPSLKGSKASVDRMDKDATREGFTRLETPADVDRFIRQGRLVALPGNSRYRVEGAVHPFVRPVAKLFVERFAQEIAPICDLVVTSATRSKIEQPRNASPKSVHPTGIAVDFRIPADPSCVLQFEKTLLYLEGLKVIEATREKSPPHFHVAIFQDKYASYVKSQLRPRKPAPKRSAKK